MTDKFKTIDKGSFYVIEFFDGIQIIPDNWIIQDETLVYWPKVKSDKEYDIMAYTRSSVKDDWSIEPIKTILYKTDKFSDAKLKLKKAEYLTDVDSPYNTDEGKKQRRENAKIHFNDDNDDEEQIREKNKKIKPKKTNLPSLPEPPVIATHRNKADILNKCAITAIHSTANISNKCAIITTHNKVNISNDSSVMDTKSSENHQKQDVILSSNNENKINHDTYRILKGIENLKTSINGITYLIREVIQRLDVLEKNSESLKVQSTLDEYNSLSIFPIQTIASLKEVETKIENDSAFKIKLIESLTQVSSADVKKTIRNTLHYLISDEMAQQYSWLGQRHKAAFQNLQISKIVIITVKMRHQNTTHEQISSIAAEWLKHAKQRAQRKSKKEEKCQQEIQSSSSNSDSEEN